MFDLQDFIKNAMPQSRRQFLTFSSASIITMAASSVFPVSAKVASWLIEKTGNDINELDNIDYYVKSSNIIPDSDTIHFEV
uniref:twin-arginine translocation signal domain-containing protein n=1 Tax=Aeromonas lacus TaxID=558884 RepID=UPI001269EE6C